LRQNVLVMGGDALRGVAAPAGVTIGAVKLHFHEDALPELDVLIARITAAHAAGRPVAVHCVTRAELFLSLAAIEAAGAHHGDRIEHAAVAPPEAVDWIARLGLTVVTQPHFIAERGEAYRADVAAADRPYLYRLRAWRQAGVRLAAGSDAPLGGMNPWAGMAAAVRRPAGLAPGEALSRRQALGLYLGRLDDPGGAPRVVAVGAPADLCVLDRGWCAAAGDLAAVRVRATLRGGDITHVSGTP
jgi:predicted amidohydrolase YtcJ